MHLFIESLGCARNQVDSENMAGQARSVGWTLARDPAKADVIVVNTCSFVESAINESIDTILELSRFKEEGRCKRIVVAGCLPERFREAIADALPEVDQFLGTGAFTRIVDAASGKLAKGTSIFPDQDRIPMENAETRERELSHTAYLKIAEGCSRHCSYCIIPKLRGSQRSRPMPQILDEARKLISSGVKELNLVSQDTTHYGYDLVEPVGLDELLEQLAGINDDIWIRFLYGHPESITKRVIDTVASHDNLCSYFDLPVQHSAAGVLRKMGRYYDKDQLLDLFSTIRSKVPGATIRTTLIVGFPGETEKDFNELLDFVEKVRFDHLGVFTYSDSEDLPSHQLPGRVPEEIAQSRHDALMSRQLEISSDNLTSLIHQILPVIIEDSPEPNLFEGRTMNQAPEVDGLTFIRTAAEAAQPSIGDIVSVKVTETLEYDLIGEIQCSI
jgi:ribosomal protein S12 methylthiotransferase